VITGSNRAQSAGRTREWQRDDLDEIVRINRASQPHVAPLDRRELERLGGLGAHVFVNESSGRPAAYLIVFSATAPYDGEEFGWFRRRSRDGFWYVDQLAIDPVRRRSGIGRELYAHVAASSRASGACELCCEVNLWPPNPDSLAFHRRLGFREVGELDVSDGRRVALLTWRLEIPAPGS
jgi:predicted GNAT superfamily acetyltransferase